VFEKYLPSLRKTTLTIHLRWLSNVAAQKTKTQLTTSACCSYTGETVGQGEGVVLESHMVYEKVRYLLVQKIIHALLLHMSHV
jgi:hypothetical protein